MKKSFIASVFILVICAAFVAQKSFADDKKQITYPESSRVSVTYPRSFIYGLKTCSNFNKTVTKNSNGKSTVEKYEILGFKNGKCPFTIKYGTAKAQNLMFYCSLSKDELSEFHKALSTKSTGVVDVNDQISVNGPTDFGLVTKYMAQGKCGRFVYVSGKWFKM